jgi:hypothetical protein
LKIWITPLASVAMLEKLALLKIAVCRAPILTIDSADGAAWAPSAIGPVGRARPVSASILEMGCPDWNARGERTLR